MGSPHPYPTPQCVFGTPRRADAVRNSHDHHVYPKLDITYCGDAMQTHPHSFLKAPMKKYSAKIYNLT